MKTFLHVGAWYAAFTKALPSDLEITAIVDDPTAESPSLVDPLAGLVAKNFASDAAAATGGVQVGKLYHTNGVVAVRLV